MFGSHLSIAGGLFNALLSAEKLGLNTVQIFTKNQQQWAVKPLQDADIAEWKREAKRLAFKQTVSHDSYLINLASPDDKLWLRSLNLFADEISRCVMLGIPYLVAHPGAHMGSGEETGLKRVAAAIDKAYAGVRGARTITCLEITAGQGTSLGWRLEHLAKIIEHSKHPQRLAVCLDTAHLFAAGYDFRGRKYDGLLKEIDKTVGKRLIKVLHLNDSKKQLGSRVDRHEHIGRGFIGLEGFRPWVCDPDFANVPKIMETPKDGAAEDGREWDVVNVEVLRGLL